MRDAPRPPEGWELTDRLGPGHAPQAIYVDQYDNMLNIEPRWENETSENSEWILQVIYNDGREPRYDVHDSLEAALRAAGRIMSDRPDGLGGRGSSVPDDFDFTFP